MLRCRNRLELVRKLNFGQKPSFFDDNGCEEIIQVNIGNITSAEVILVTNILGQPMREISFLEKWKNGIFN
jgi:hypothetical protein